LSGRFNNEIEELVLQGIGHVERRNILKIIASAPGGVIYSEILYELQLNTGKLNYHLKLLEGLIERDENRRYHISKLGKKAVSILNNLTADLDEEDITQFKDVKTSQDEFINGIVNMWSRLAFLGSISAFLGLVVFINTSVRAGLSSNTAYIWLVIPGGLLVWMYLWLEKVRREAPEKIINFLHRFNLIK
jgi:predicted transcriptional regulator